jgi:thioredoxin-like negative regulator of GroEL
MKFHTGAFLDHAFNQSNKFLIILFTSRNSKPSLETLQNTKKILKKFKPNFEFFEVDIDEYPDLVVNYRASIVPTIMIFKDRIKLFEKITKMNLDDLEVIFTQYL